MSQDKDMHVGIIDDFRSGRIQLAMHWSVTPEKLIFAIKDGDPSLEWTVLELLQWLRARDWAELAWKKREALPEPYRGENRVLVQHGKLTVSYLCALATFESLPHREVHHLQDTKYYKELLAGLIWVSFVP